MTMEPWIVTNLLRKPTIKDYIKFTDLAPGTYVVREVVDSGYKQTAPSGGFAQVTLGEDEIVSDINFGNTSN